MQLPLAMPLKPPRLLTDPHVVCPNCDSKVGSGLTLIDDFFMEDSLICDECHFETNAWDAYLATINHPVPFMHDAAAMFIGCKTLVFSVYLTAGTVKEILFIEQGIPDGSRILRLNYTAQGSGVRPVELHGNDVSFRRARDTVYLYGKPSRIPTYSPAFAASPSTVKVSVLVTFAEPSAREHSESALAIAFNALNADEYKEMVIPATMAIEFTCKKLIADLKNTLQLDGEGTKDKDLLSKLIPRIASAVEVPALKKIIIHKVCRLWGQRDRVAHEGRLHEPYERLNAGEQLAAAVFVFRYLQLLRRLAEAKNLLTGD